MPATYEPIATASGQTPSGLTFSNIPNTYTDLKFVLVARVDSISDIPILTFNGSSSTYSVTTLNGSGSATSSARTTGSSRILINTVNSAIYTTFGLYQFDIFNYASSTNKTVLISGSADINSSLSGNVFTSVGLWQSTSAITSLTINTLNMGIDNTFLYYNATLYGIKAA